MAVYCRGSKKIARTELTYWSLRVLHRRKRGLDIMKVRRSVQHPVQLRVLNAIKYWIDAHWRDFDDSLRQSCREFLTMHAVGIGNGV